jgi:hypothetical protein
MLSKNYFIKLDFKKIFYAFVFIVVSFLLMRYYAYLGNPNLGIKELKDFSSRGFLTYLIYFIFSIILYSAARNMHIMKRAIFVISITFLLAFCDAITDYITGFHFPLISLLINESSAILSFLLIVSYSVYKQYFIKNYH